MKSGQRGSLWRRYGAVEGGDRFGGHALCDCKYPDGLIACWLWSNMISCPLLCDHPVLVFTFVTRMEQSLRISAAYRNRGRDLTTGINPVPVQCECIHVFFWAVVQR